MAIFVKHLKTGNEYILIGTSLSPDKTFNLPFLRGNLIPEKDPEEIYWVALCDQQGTIFWLPNSEVIITEVDGKTPSELLEGKITQPATVILDQDSVTPLNEQSDNWENSEEEDEDWV